MSEQREVAHPARDPSAFGEYVHELAEQEAQRAEAEPDEEEAAAAEEEEVQEELGPDEAPPLDPYTAECPICQGWGITRTRSRVDIYITRSCAHCGGMGYKELPPPSPELEQLPGPHDAAAAYQAAY